MNINIIISQSVGYKEEVAEIFFWGQENVRHLLSHVYLEKEKATMMICQER